MLEITTPSYKDLTEEEKENVSNNGSGKEYASYIKVMYNNELICLRSDAMEPKDTVFYRNLDWIVPLLKEVYKLGENEQLR